MISDLVTAEAGARALENARCLPIIIHYFELVTDVAAAASPDGRVNDNKALYRFDIIIWDAIFGRTARYRNSENARDHRWAVFSIKSNKSNE